MKRTYKVVTMVTLTDDNDNSQWVEPSARYAKEFVQRGCQMIFDEGFEEPIIVEGFEVVEAEEDS